MTEKQPLVSIITPSYNSEKYIRETVKSVQEQTYTNWEMIIVDDCSSDNSRAVLEELARDEERVKIHFLQENSGAAVARNTAIKLAKGQYIAFLDSDDKWKPNKLQTQLDFMRNNNYAFSFTSYDLMNENGELLDKSVHVPTEIDYHGLLKNTIIGCLTVMIDKEKVGDFQMPNIRARQDFALWLLILKRGFKAYGLQQSLAIYRIVPGSVSSNKVNMIKKNWYVYRKIENLNVLSASWYIFNYAFNALKKRL